MPPESPSSSGARHAFFQLGDGWLDSIHEEISLADIDCEEEEEEEEEEEPIEEKVSLLSTKHAVTADQNTGRLRTAKLGASQDIVEGSHELDEAQHGYNTVDGVAEQGSLESSSDDTHSTATTDTTSGNLDDMQDSHSSYSQDDPMDSTANTDANTLDGGLPEAAAGVLTESFMDKCFDLNDLDESQRQQTLDNLEAAIMDVDRWELVISPIEYLARFKDTLSTVQLVNRAPLRRLHTTYHRGPDFSKWLLLADATHQLWIDSKHKDVFFEFLNDYQVAQPGALIQQASTGRALISTAVFVHCLISAGCNSIRLKAYGQKMPIDGQFMKTEPAQVDHPWAEHNEWDIGTTFTSDNIWLFGSLTGRQHGLTRYPMLVPASLDYGTVNIKLKHNQQHFSIKIYPRIVHVIKSFNSHLQGSIPKTLNGVRMQVASGLRMIHSLTGKSETELGGFRIEITVKAASLKEAVTRVKKTPFLDPNHWLGYGPGPHSPTPLSVRLVSRDSMLQNAMWVYQQAINVNIFRGEGSNRPSTLQIKALTDIFNALGWNSGLRNGTKSLNQDAWWYGHTPRDAGSSLFHTLAECCGSDLEVKALFNAARTMAGTVPCKAYPDDRQHRYQVNSNTPFRVRCCKSGCYHKLNRSALVHWIATLAQQGWVNGDTLKAVLTRSI